MTYGEDEFYERYRHYELNRYHYRQEQMVFPLAIIAIGAIMFSLRKIFLIAVGIACAIAVPAVVIYWYMKKQVVGSQPIELTAEQARDGVKAHIKVKYNSSQAELDLDIPANVKNGQRFVVKNLLFEDEKGKKVKKRLYLTVRIS